MISLFFGAYHVLVPFFASTDNVIRYSKNVDLDTLNRLWAHMVSLLQFQNALQSRLRVELSVVLLDACAADDLEILLLPVKLKVSGNALHKAFAALEHLYWTRDPTHDK